MSNKQDAISLLTNANNVQQNFPDGVFMPLYFQAPYTPVTVNVEQIFDDCSILVTPQQNSDVCCDAISFLELLTVPAGLSLSLSYYGLPTERSILQNFVAGLIHAAKRAEKFSINPKTEFHVRFFVPETVDSNKILQRICALDGRFEQGVNLATKYYTDAFNF